MKSNSIRQDSPEKFEAIEQNTIELPLDKIRISNRTRRNLGDISNLAESMAKLGLLHAVVVNPEYELIVGERRYAGAEQLGWPTIRAYVARNLTDALTRLEAERDENTCRLDLAPSEAVALGERLEK